ncbi:reversion-inducing cysteine-rich protein with Kazal motifs-like isoform X1 [Clavelina lepadiformis]|uniref:reversion-inducing cysteine-rich protein with Kazal motifs-like isoform X1 n=1 Tax=Clavelina lepadiformis TaxID=159417 RepID=UPI0040427D22
MKYYIFVIFLRTVLGLNFAKEEAYCCRYASSVEDCLDTCLEIYNTNDAVYLEKLQMHFPTNCPKNSIALIDFWNCFSPENVSDGAWIGRECCELAVTDQCRSVCLKGKGKEDLVGECRSDYEEGLYSCIFKLESKQRCCGKRNTATGKSCRHRCDMAFRSELGPTSDDIKSVAKSCDATMAQCMANYTQAVRTSSIESMHCCEYAPKESCKQSCKRILKTEITDRAIVSGLVDACGDVMPHEPLWKCFMHNTKSEPQPQPGPWGTKLQCCDRALSYNCKYLCHKLYENPWPDPNKWNRFEQQCEHNTDEMELRQCLEEVSEPCRIGCSDLSFCTSFNNRPTSMFHSCNSEADDMARDHFNAWSDGVIQLPFVDIPVKDIQRCETEKWKAVACALQIKPCSSRTGESIICQSDCVSLLNKCIDKNRFPARISVEDLCEKFSPSHLQQNCISLSTYSRPGQSANKESSEVTQPCHPNPCSDGEVCVLNGKKCDADQSCPQFSCLSGCKMGHGSSFVVSHGSLVRVPDKSRGEGCFQSCVCSANGFLRPCTELPCTDLQKPCKLAGQLRSHGSSFKVDCNFCNCFAGNVTCTTRQCQATDIQKGAFTGIAGNCPAFYQPVCGKNGQTYPSMCVAKWLGQETDSVSSGSCLSKRPCHPNPCKPKERCVPTPRVCLSDLSKCRQHECLPRFRQCTRLLKSATPPLKSYRLHSHRYLDFKNVLSSSRFFSNTALLANNTVVCDAKNQQFEDICKLIRSKHRSFAYQGSCQANCYSRYAHAVCGQDGVTYNHSCMADANGVLIDHLGPCRSIGSATNEDGTGSCAGVVCPPLSNPRCHKIRPPGSCCSLCGGMFRVLINRIHLRAISEASWNGPVTMRDVIFLLRRQLHILECNAYGQLTTEGDMAIVIVSRIPKPSLIQEEACTREAERLSRLINTRSPTLTSYLILSPLTASEISAPGDGGSASKVAPFSKNTLFLSTIVTLLHFLVRQCIT